MMQSIPLCPPSILSDPKNDHLRLDLANQWSEDPALSSHAEFIRLQIALENHSSEDRDWLQLVRRERELLETNRLIWERPLRNRIRPSIRTPGKWLHAHLFGTGGTWGFRRGFVEQIVTSASRFLKEDIPLLTQTPIQEVLLTNASSFIEELAKDARLDGIRSLYLVSDAELDDDMDLLLQATRHLGLETIEIKLPRLDSELLDLVIRLKSAEETEAILQDFPIWRYGTEVQRKRLTQLAQKPRFFQRLSDPDSTTELDLLRWSNWIWYGDSIDSSNIWANAKTYHDLGDTEGFSRQVLLIKSSPEKASIISRLRAFSDL
jgi:hypothetical protein